MVGTPYRPRGVWHFLGRCTLTCGKTSCIPICMWWSAKRIRASARGHSQGNKARLAIAHQPYGGPNPDVLVCTLPAAKPVKGADLCRKRRAALPLLGEEEYVHIYRIPVSWMQYRAVAHRIWRMQADEGGIYLQRLCAVVGAVWAGGKCV